MFGMNAKQKTYGATTKFNTISEDDELCGKFEPSRTSR